MNSESMADEQPSEWLALDEEAEAVDGVGRCCCHKVASTSLHSLSCVFLAFWFFVFFSTARRSCHDWVLPVQAQASMASRIAVGYLISFLNLCHSSSAAAAVMHVRSRMSRRIIARVLCVGMMFAVGLGGLLVVLGGAQMDLKRARLRSLAFGGAQ